MTESLSFPHRRPPFAILIATTATGPLAMGIFLPSMPGLMRVFDAGYGTVQLTLTLYMVGFAAAQLVFGPLSDRFGRRPVILAGLTLFVAASAACLAATSIETLIAARIVQSVGGCAGMVIVRAIIRDLYDRDQSASQIAYVTMAAVLMTMIGPVIGGYLDDWFGWRAIFAVVTAFGAIVLVFAVFTLHETRMMAQRRIAVLDFSSDFMALLRIRSFCGYTLQLSFTSGVYFGFLGGAPYVMMELMGRSPSEYGLYFLLVSVSYTASNFIAGKISSRMGIERMIVAGMVIAVVGTTGLTLLWASDLLTPLVLFGAMAVVSLGNGLAIPNGMAGAVSADPVRAGAASGLAGFIQMTAGAGAALLVGALLADTATPLVGVMLGGTVLAVAAHVVGVRPRPAPELR
ncbi:MAG: multidrug effflux MFS transporter [Rhodospirillales bacterium]|jgi:DHA1 family bicyclomycin/chloramphenicol resistance-like MFS transporter|nr:multidrug effflux MFS transporter [Rhodospirillales bacterium]